MNSAHTSSPSEQTAAGPDPTKPPHRRGLIRRLVGGVFRWTRNVLALCMLGIVIFVMTPLENRVYDALNVAIFDPDKADAILCLGGGWGREERAAILWHRKFAPVVAVSNKAGAAEWMRTMVQEQGVPRHRILVDNTSATTHDHPEGIARLPGINRETQRFIIVTDRPHSRRARACFLKAGYKNVVVWSGYRTVPGNSYWSHCSWRIYNLPPLIYEMSAWVKYKLQGKL